MRMTDEEVKRVIAARMAKAEKHVFPRRAMRVGDMRPPLRAPA